MSIFDIKIQRDVFYGISYGKMIKYVLKNKIQITNMQIYIK